MRSFHQGLWSLYCHSGYLTWTATCPWMTVAFLRVIAKKKEQLCNLVAALTFKLDEGLADFRPLSLLAFRWAWGLRDLDRSLVLAAPTGFLFKLCLDYFKSDLELDEFMAFLCPDLKLLNSLTNQNK